MTLSDSSVTAAARLVRDHLTGGGELSAVIMRDTGEGFLAKWASSAARRVNGPVVVLHGDLRTVTGDSFSHLDLPADVSGILDAAGVAVPGDVTGWVIAPDGSVQPPASEEDDFDDWGIPDDEMSAEPQADQPQEYAVNSGETAATSATERTEDDFDDFLSTTDCPGEPGDAIGHHATDGAGGTSGLVSSSSESTLPDTQDVEASHTDDNAAGETVDGFEDPPQETPDSPVTSADENEGADTGDDFNTIVGSADSPHAESPSDDNDATGTTDDGPDLWTVVPAPMPPTAPTAPSPSIEREDTAPTANRTDPDNADIDNATLSALERRRAAREKAAREEDMDEDQLVQELAEDDTPRRVDAIRERAEVTHRPSLRTNLSPVIVCMSAKGGVGKTTSSVYLPCVASELGLKSVLIDGSRGQADISTVLRINTNDLPTLYEAAVDAPATAIVKPDALNERRGDLISPLQHAVVFGPPPALSDPTIVNAGVYRDAITAAREQADLVVIDTQIMESSDTSGLWDQVLIPLLREDGWAVAVTDLTWMSLRNLKQRLITLDENGVPPNRILSFANANKLIGRNAKEAEASVTDVEPFLSKFSTFVGNVPSLPEIGFAMNAGDITSPPQPLLNVLHEVLHRVTGVDIPEAEETKKPGLFARLFGGR